MRCNIGALLVMSVLVIGPSVALGSQADASSKPPTKLILDTDIGGDIDDALALALIHALESRNECELLAVTVCSNNEFNAPFVDIVDTFYGRPEIPIGFIRNRKATDPARYTKTPVEARDNGIPRYPHRLLKSGDAPEAVSLLRKTLATQPDGAVTMLSIGHLTNMATLLESKSDAYSPLAGKDLVAKKVRLYVMMAGAYTPRSDPEWNVLCDGASSVFVFKEWPTPIIASGFEIGLAVPFPGERMKSDFNYVIHHPVRDAYFEYFGGNPGDRPSWDPTAVLEAVRPNFGYFGLSKPGTISVGANNATHFQPSDSGRHRYLTISPDQSLIVREALVDLISQPQVPGEGSGLSKRSH
jgi:inosine-uridine nucleoside N-ribohydrolase